MSSRVTRPSDSKKKAVASHVVIVVDWCMVYVVVGLCVGVCWWWWLIVVYVSLAQHGGKSETKVQTVSTNSIFDFQVLVWSYGSVLAFGVTVWTFGLDSVGRSISVWSRDQTGVPVW
jgi:hypothetical protein